MPFRSKAQARYLFATHPQIAREFAQKTPSIKALPEHVHRRKPDPSDEAHRALGRIAKRRRPKGG